MTGFTAKHLAVVASLALAAVAPGSTAQAETVPVNVCSDQNTGDETDSSYCEAGESAIPDQENQGNGNFNGDGNGNSSDQGNDQGNDNFNDQLSEQPAGGPER
jgi:hypothetical protein